MDNNMETNMGNNMNYQAQGAEQYQYNNPGQDPLLTQPVMPKKKAVSKGESIGSIVGTVLLFKIFGILGAAICYGGYAAIRAVTRSVKLSTGAKVAISILLGFLFVGLLIAYIIFSAMLTSSMN